MKKKQLKKRLAKAKDDLWSVRVKLIILRKAIVDHCEKLKEVCDSLDDERTVDAVAALHETVTELHRVSQNTAEPLPPVES